MDRARECSREVNRKCSKREDHDATGRISFAARPNRGGTEEEMVGRCDGAAITRAITTEGLEIPVMMIREVITLSLPHHLVIPSNNVCPSDKRHVYPENVSARTRLTRP